jgi:probable selenium-dependent hydroxylase accessory protein YqeC
MTDDDLLDLFGARRGVICAVGAGGKKSTLYSLLMRHPGRVALTATVFTARFPAHLGLQSVIAEEVELAARLAPLAEANRLGFAAPSAKPGRYAGIAPGLVSQLHADTERDATFVKADGARMRWMKAPREGEPVLPPDCSTLICVLSAKALGRPLSDEIAHRLQQISSVTGLQTGEIIEPKHLAGLLVSDAGLLRGSAGRSVVPVINMVDDASHERLARQAAEIALAETDRFDRVILASMRRDDQPVVAVIER